MEKNDKVKITMGENRKNDKVKITMGGIWPKNQVEIATLSRRVFMLRQ
jgi:hypothetical protein